jgi:hypothetical protein
LVFSYNSIAVTLSDILFLQTGTPPEDSQDLEKPLDMPCEELAGNMLRRTLAYLRCLQESLLRRTLAEFSCMFLTGLTHPHLPAGYAQTPVDSPSEELEKSLHQMCSAGFLQTVS